MSEMEIACPASLIYLLNARTRRWARLIIVIDRLLECGFDTTHLRRACSLSAKSVFSLSSGTSCAMLAGVRDVQSIVVLAWSL
jgi:hypothetical protein